MFLSRHANDLLLRSLESERATYALGGTAEQHDHISPVITEVVRVRQIRLPFVFILLRDQNRLRLFL